jgi:CheY-like chemotaxis protein
LHLQSQLGEGSCFEFELSFPVIDAEPLVALPELSIKGLRVLVVEDNAMVAELLLRIIEALGWDAQHAANGMAAIAAIQAARQGKNRFELVLMDWKMPGLDGLSVARLILQDSLSEAPPIVIMLTAYDKEMMIAALQDEEMPFVDSLTKPVTPQQLLASVQKALAGNAQQLPLKEKLQRLQGLSLLVVEDNELNRQIACELLAGEGAQVSVAEGGLSGVEQVLSAQKRFDAVLMDVQMPDIDGLEATRRIRADARFAQLPIIAMTANASQSDRQNCLDAGMNEHIGKPVDLPQLIGVLLRYVGQNTGNDAAPAKKSSGFVESIHSISARFGGNMRLYRTVQENFRSEANKQLAMLKVALSGRDVDAVLHALHALNGCAASLGALALARRLAGLESQIKQAKRPNLDAMLGADVLADLELLVLESDLLLKHKLSELNESPLQPASPALTTPTLKQLLLELLPLLDSANLRALELLEAEPSALLSEQQDLWRQLKEQVQALDFSAASLTVKKILVTI